MGTFTPGPWHVAEQRDHYDVVIRSASDLPIAAVYLLGHDEDAGPAHARLIAEAPLLLASHRELLAAVEGYLLDPGSLPNVNRLTAARLQARAALVKVDP